MTYLNLILINKKENNIAIFQPERWKVIAEYAKQKAFETGRSQEFIQKIFKAIHEKSIEIQNNILTIFINHNL